MRSLLTAVAGLAACATTAAAESIKFDASVGSICTIYNLRDGVMLSKDNGTVLCSRFIPGCGRPARFWLTVTEHVDLQFSAAFMSAMPTGYAGPPIMRYRVADPQDIIDELAPFDDFEAGARSYRISYPGGKVSVRNYIEDPAGLPEGAYRMSVTVSCIPAVD